MNKTELRSTRKCPVCEDSYNDNQNAPMQLPCSHNLCRYCLATQTEEDNYIRCSICSSCFPADAEYPTNIKIINIIKRISMISKDNSTDAMASLCLNCSPDRERMGQISTTKFNKFTPISVNKSPRAPSFVIPNAKAQCSIVDEDQIPTKQRNAYQDNLNSMHKFGVSSFMSNKNLQSAWCFTNQASPPTISDNSCLFPSVELPDGHPNKCSNPQCNKPRLQKDGFSYPYCCIQCSQKMEKMVKDVCG